MPTLNSGKKRYVSVKEMRMKKIMDKPKIKVLRQLRSTPQLSLNSNTNYLLNKIQDFLIKQQIPPQRVSEFTYSMISKLQPIYNLQGILNDYDLVRAYKNVLKELAIKELKLTQSNKLGQIFDKLDDETADQLLKKLATSLNPNKDADKIIEDHAHLSDIDDPIVTDRIQELVNELDYYKNKDDYYKNKDENENEDEDEGRQRVYSDYSDITYHDFNEDKDIVNTILDTNDKKREAFEAWKTGADPSEDQIWNELAKFYEPNELYLMSKYPDMTERSFNTLRDSNYFENSIEDIRKDINKFNKSDDNKSFVMFLRKNGRI